MQAVSFAEVIDAHHALFCYQRMAFGGDSAMRPDGMAPGMVPEPADVVDDGEAPGASVAGATETRLRDDYKTKLVSFCGRATLDEVFWAQDGHSGACVILEGSRFRRRARLYRVSDAATSQAPKIASAIHDWDVLAVRAQMLRGMHARVCTRRIFSSINDLLVAALAPNCGDDAIKEIVDKQAADLKLATEYYVENA